MFYQWIMNLLKSSLNDNSKVLKDISYYTLVAGPTSINLNGNSALEANFVFMVGNTKYNTAEIWTISEDRKKAYQ